ncbi:ABC transporter, permease protein (cluster 3, basic aa/glutamine/opines), partial [Arthrobacter sp. DR-2P]
GNDRTSTSQSKPVCPGRNLCCGHRRTDPGHRLEDHRQQRLQLRQDRADVPGHLCDWPGQHPDLHVPRLHRGPFRRPAAGPDEALKLPAVPLDRHRLHRVLPRHPGAAGLHRLRLRCAAGVRCLVEHHRDRHGLPGHGGLGLHRRNPPRRPAGSAEGPAGSRPVAGHAAVAGHGHHRHPAGLQDRPAAADQRGHPADQGLLPDLCPGPHRFPVRAHQVRSRRHLEPRCRPDAAPGGRRLLPGDHHPPELPGPEVRKPHRAEQSI